LAAAIGAAGCTAAPSQPNGVSDTTLPPTVIKLRIGGTVTVAVPYLPTNFNPSTPAGANEVTQMVMEQVWPQGVTVDPTFNPVPSTAFATSELISIAPQTVQYKIDPRAVWSDGTPITLQDFFYNWRQQLQTAGSLPFSGVLTGYEDISSVTSSQKGLVTVKFRRPYADWEGLFGNMVPAHVAERIGWGGFDTAHVGDVLSAGPFVVASVVPGRELVLKRNRRWWGTPARLNEIVFRVVRGEAALWSGLRSGAISLAEVATGSGVLARASSDGLTASTTLSPLLWQICFNLGDAVVGQPMVRRAIAASLDRVQLVDDTVGLLDPGVPVAENRLFMQLAPGADLTATPYSSTDLSIARRLFRHAGYTMGPSGYRVNGDSTLVLRISVPSGVPVIGTLEGVLRAELNQVGIKVAFVSVPMSRFVGSVLPGGGFQAAVVPYWIPVYQSWGESVYGGGTPAAPAPGSTSGSSSLSGSAWLGSVLSEAGEGAGRSSSSSAGATSSDGSPGFVTSNVARLTDGAIGTLYKEASEQLDLPTARGLYNEINTLLWNDLPTIPLFEQPVTLVTAHDLVNVSLSPSWAGVMWNAPDWGIATNLPAPTTTTS
jgi:peptide/nickel transport system substrate-binding protein